MKCRYCKREIQDNSIFCNWCGKEQKKDKTEISVPKPRRLADGRYTAQIMVDGVRVSVPPQPTEAKYRAAAMAIKTGAEKIEKRDNRIVGDVVDEYIKYREERPQDFSPSTVDGYMRKRKNNLQSLVTLKIADMTKEKVQSAIDIDREKYSGKTIKEAWALISAATKVKYKDLQMPDTTPQKEPPVLSSEDIKKLLLSLAEIGGQKECAGLLALWCSLRRSEIKGLRWSDIGENCVTIRKAQVYDKSHKLVEKKTKNIKSTRTVLCDKYIIDKINALPHDGENVITISTSSMWDGITAACENAGIEHTYLHGLRHTNASIMEYLNISPKYANQRGGWASDHVRQKTYVGVMDEGQIEAAKEIDNFFNGLIEDGKNKDKITTKLLSAK